MVAYLRRLKAGRIDDMQVFFVLEKKSGPCDM